MSERIEACVVLVTCATAEAAVALASTVVEERLAACGNIVPGVRSIYRWQGAVQEDAEVLLLLKTVAARVPALSARVRDLHSYDVPEVLALPVLGGLQRYLEWIEESTSAVEDK
jgi:periplasmic divalent cation tolerance protein